MAGNVGADGGDGRVNTFEEYYQEYEKEVEELLGYFLCWRMLREKTNSDPDLLAAIQNNSRSWIIIQNSLLKGFITVLHRIFEGNKKHYSIFDLIDFCIKNIDIFSKEKLRIRKNQGSNKGEPDWLSEYMKNVYVPIEGDFYKLLEKAKEKRKLFNENYRDIRNKLIGHKHIDFIGNENNLWEKTNISEIEEIIFLLDDLMMTLHEAYHNGKKPVLKKRKTNRALYEEDFAKLLDNIKQYNSNPQRKDH